MAAFVAPLIPPAVGLAETLLVGTVLGTILGLGITAGTVGQGSAVQNEAAKPAADCTAECEEAKKKKAKEDSDAEIKKLLDKTKLDPKEPNVGKRGETENRIRCPGGEDPFDQANKDFDEMDFVNVKPDPRNPLKRTGTLKDGREVTVRPDSRRGEPTITISAPRARSNKNREIHKIRYRP